MISKLTAQRIWNCHNQIEECNKLLSTMKEEIAKKGDPIPDDDPFGHKRGLDLGIPSSGGSRRILGVRIDLGLKIIESHIEDNEKKLAELMAFASIELKG